MNYEWDPAKTEANLAKHGVRFVWTWREEATIRLISARRATSNDQRQYARGDA